MAFWAAALPIIKALAGGAASGAAGAAVTKAGSKKHLPPVTGNTPIMPPASGGETDDLVKAILMANIKEQYADKEEGEEAREEQAQAVAQDVAEAAKR